MEELKKYVDLTVLKEYDKMLKNYINNKLSLCKQNSTSAPTMENLGEINIINPINKGGK